MQGLKKKRRIQLLTISVLSLAAATALIGFGMRDGIAFFRSPAQVLEELPGPEEVFRIGGLVEPDSIEFGDHNRIHFLIADGAASIRVNYVGILPDLFAEGQGAIALGRYVNGTFEATEILAKHDETYLPKEIAEALKEQGVFREPRTQY